MLLSRRTVALAGAASLAGIGPALAQTSDEMTIGAATARASLIEYASTTCPHCAAFHEHNWAILKADYIDTGRLRLTLREMATPPPAVAVAMFQLARAQGAGAAEYFRRLAVLYERQQGIFQVRTMAELRTIFVALGAEWGMSEDEVMAALTDESGAERVRRSMDEASRRGVDSTPTFFLNGERITDGAFHTPDGMRRRLDAATA